MAYEFPIFPKHNLHSHAPSDYLLSAAPTTVEFEVLSSCNLNCSYCYAKPFSGGIASLPDLASWFAKTKQEINPPDVIIVGGEPFLRKDITDVMAIAARTFGHFGISTNGTLFGSLTDDQFETLRYVEGISGNRTIQVSIDSIDPEVNARTRSDAQGILRGLERLERNGVSFMVGIVLTKANVATVRQTLLYLLEHYRHLSAIHLQDLKPTVSLGKDYLALRLEASEYFSIGEIAAAVQDQLGRHDVSIYQFGESRPKAISGRSPSAHTCMVGDDCGFTYHSRCYHDDEDSGFCVAGRTRAGVFVNGDVTPCLLLRHTRIGNLRYDSWAEIWERSLDRYSRLADSGLNPGDQCFVLNATLEQRNLTTEIALSA
jgi:MoaA/NifB/PqqE/SkfB family radical SAM enzyme